nr:hypothetical protein [Sphingomonas sp. CDS-1]
MRARLEVPAAQIVEWRWEDAWVGRVATRAVERLMEIAGSKAHFNAQRFQRDVHTADSHVYFDTDAGLQILGRKMLGLPDDQGLF